MDRSEIPNDTRYQGIPSGASKLISKHIVCSMQTMHLPCIRIGTISKLTEPSFHLSLFTQEYQIVRPKWFLRLWCIRRKLCTYLAQKYTMSRNGPKQDSIWHTSSRSSIGCVCGGINPYTLTARLGPGGLAHYETSSRFDLTARSFAQGNKTWRSSRILVG